MFSPSMDRATSKLRKSILCFLDVRVESRASFPSTIWMSLSFSAAQSCTCVGSAYRADLDLVFANPDGTPLKPDSISASVSALFKRLKIPKPKGAALHLLRHTHTSVLLAEGVPLPAVSARLGHSSVRTTQEIYAHMITGQDEEAARKWEEYQKLNRPAAAENRKGSVQ